MLSHVATTELDSWFAALLTNGSTTAGTPRATGLVLDVREPWELQTASVHAPAAAHWLVQHIPMNDIPARLAELDPSVPVACLCHHGVRSLRVAQFLVHNGFEHVANINGGIDAWSQQRDPGVQRYG
jgi:rhodanese-related sulfurtransferase